MVNSNIVLRIAGLLLYLHLSPTLYAATPNNQQQPNIVFILVDDLRHDVFSHTGHPFVETPNTDSLAADGLRFENAFVTTSLCSPARASFLTGQYMHHHRVVDNQSRIPGGTVTFPQLLKQTGYQTAFIGKWHMGGTRDDPRPGFDHWVSFRGQGNYFPKGQTLNIDGKQVKQTEYMTDEVTHHAINWLEQRQKEEPFLLYLSHKGVHGLYDPAPRHLNHYQHAEWQHPPSMVRDNTRASNKPMWVSDQRNSWHGVEYAYYGKSKQSLGQMYRHYCEMVLSIDESVGKVLETIKNKGLDENTLVVFTSDGGHLWGEQGLIDKRCAYEASIRIPMIIRYPKSAHRGVTNKQMVTNIDVAPTLLELANITPPESMDGASFANLLHGNSKQAENPLELLYEYYWEPSFPQTPTTFAIRNQRYKLIQYHGIWDRDELYDIQNDRDETHNLIDDPLQQDRVATMRRRLYGRLQQTGGLVIPLGFKRNAGSNLRKSDGSLRAEFPDSMLKAP